MTKSPVPTLPQLEARLHQQGLEVASLRAALDVQLVRIAQMQAELDVLPQARRSRQLLSASLIQPSHNGNGHGAR